VQRCAMRSGRQWVLLMLAAVVVSCLIPGSMLSEAAPISRTVSVLEATSLAPSGSECAALSCQRGSPSTPAPVPALALACALAFAALVALSVGAFRRSRPARIALPAGIPLRLLRPPQATRTA
jgi:hypothetical protein